MSRGVQWSLSGFAVLVALTAVAGCSHYWVGERESWRRDAEIACLNSGAVKETPQRVRVSAINGPGMCGADFPLRVSALGDSAPLGYDDEAIRPPSTIPGSAMPQRWPGERPTVMPLPPPSGMAAQPLAPPGTYPAPAGPPLSLNPPGLLESTDEDVDYTPAPPRPYYNAPPPASAVAPAPAAPLGPSNGSMVTGAAGAVEVKPPAVLACPIVARLDQWIAAAVQPAALRWFQQPVAEIKQISAYSCRGMNGNPNAQISEHAFGNALDIAEFLLADGHKISVQHGWHGTPEEQGFLHDVQATACQEFTTVLAPGANVYHYNHIHVDLMRHASGRRICQPAAVPGDVVAERARARYAAQHYGDPGVTGALASKPWRTLGYSGEDDDRLPLAVPGED